MSLKLTNTYSQVKNIQNGIYVFIFIFTIIYKTLDMHFHTYFNKEEEINDMIEEKMVHLAGNRTQEQLIKSQHAKYYTNYPADKMVCRVYVFLLWFKIMWDLYVTVDF